MERANGNILSSLNKRLVDASRGTWADELPTVQWGHCTSVTWATGFTPFKLLFGDEAMTPAEIKGQSLRVVLPEHAGEREVSVDHVEEMRMAAAKKLRKYIVATQLWYNKKVAPRAFSLSEAVLRRALSPSKLQNKWESPFLVAGTGTCGACHLTELDGTPLPCSWNAYLLKWYCI